MVGWPNPLPTMANKTFPSFGATLSDWSAENGKGRWAVALSKQQKTMDQNQGWSWTGGGGWPGWEKPGLRIENYEMVLCLWGPSQPGNKC